MKHLTDASPSRRMCALAVLAALAFSGTGCGEQQASAAKDHSQTLTAGTAIVATLQNTIDTGKNHVGDGLTLRTVEDVLVNGSTVVPAGSTIRGEVTHIDPAGRVAGGAELTIRYTELAVSGGDSYPISATPLRLTGKGDAKESVAEVGGGAIAGGIIGGLLGGKDDIGKGAAVGAVAGAGVAIATKGDQIVLPAGQRIRIALDGPVTIATR